MEANRIKVGQSYAVKFYGASRYGGASEGKVLALVPDKVTRAYNPAIDQGVRERHCDGTKAVWGGSHYKGGSSHYVVERQTGDGRTNIFVLHSRCIVKPWAEAKAENERAKAAREASEAEAKARQEIAVAVVSNLRALGMESCTSRYGRIIELSVEDAQLLLEQVLAAVE